MSFTRFEVAVHSSTWPIDFIMHTRVQCISRVSDMVDQISIRNRCRFLFLFFTSALFAPELKVAQLIVLLYFSFEFGHRKIWLLDLVPLSLSLSIQGFSSSFHSPCMVVVNLFGTVIVFRWPHLHQPHEMTRGHTLSSGRREEEEEEVFFYSPLQGNKSLL